MSLQETISFSKIIFLLRGKRVILDFHLASMYEVENRTLKQQVRRNKERFPEDFMFELTLLEWNKVITNCDNLERNKFSPRPPMAFTEHGIAMLSSVLRSKKAIEVNIVIMRAFIKMREQITEGTILNEKLNELEKKYDYQFKVVFETIKKLIQEEKEPESNPIGFKIGK